MKFKLLTVLFLSVAMAVMAVPARKGLTRTITLEDGSTVVVELKGDEFNHYWQAADGRVFDLKTSALDRSKTAEGQLELHKMNAGTRGSIGGAHDPYVGSKKCIVILVNFTDCKFEDGHDVDYYTRMTNEEGFTDDSGNVRSVRDYFLEQSYDQLDITFDVAGPIELAHPYSYYGGDMDYVYEMITEAVYGAYKAGTDFSDYDWDGDGEVEVCYVLYAGHGAASWDDADTVWPHMSMLKYYTSQPYVNGVKVNTYACSNELSGKAESGRADGIGSMCHEFSHCLGLPDAYDTLYTGNYGMSYWSTLDAGCYLGEYSGYTPAGYTAYERWYAGWLEPIELTDEVNISDMKGLTEGGESYIIYNGGNSDEYYLLENRVATGTDEGIMNEGLLITHIDYLKKLWTNNVLNATGSAAAYNNDHQRMTVIPADNSQDDTSVTDIQGDVYPYKGNARLENGSTPAATTYNLNSDGTLYMNCSVTNITQAADKSISFTYYPAGSNPNHGNKPGGAIFYESFDYCAGEGGNDGNFSSTPSGTFSPDYSDWSCATAKGAYECAFFGSDKQVANVLMPTFTITEETALTFKAAPLTALVSGKLTISCETSGITLSETTIELTQGEWTECSIILNGVGDVTLRIKESSGINRFFMDEVAAIPTSYDGIEQVAGSRLQIADYFDLSGRAVAQPTRGLYIVNGQKVLIK